MTDYSYHYIFLAVISISLTATPRSIHHRSSHNIPCIITEWDDADVSHNQSSPKQFRLYHNNLEIGPIFHQYDRAYFLQHLLPQGIIPPRKSILPQPYTTTEEAALPSKNQEITGKELSDLLESLIREIYSINYRRSEYKDFIVIKQRDFNPKTHAGLIILKFKNYPFVVKLFMETPATFVSPFSKGFEPMAFFIMGSGINRYLSGFSRVRNAEAIRANICQSATWNDRVALPRKWFWEPINQKWFTVTSERLGTYGHSVRLPSMYAIICDAIDIETPLQILNPEHRKIGMELSRFLGARVDPHIDNFVIEKETGLIIIVDTECFSIMVGLREPLACSNYVNWYYGLCSKCWKDGFCRSKKERHTFQQQNCTTIICC